MAYKFPEVIKDIEAILNFGADEAKQELEKINTRQTELQEELAALEFRQLRVQSLKSRDDLICANCFIKHGIESPLKPLPSDSDIDLYHCKNCGAEYESNA